VLFVACAIAIGITPADARKIRAFDAAVHRWQTNPEFRAVAIEYVNLGCAAMETRLCGVRAKTAIMWFRSIPGLPVSIAVNPTSKSHYDDFSSGPLAAYFHLCGEQDVATGIGLIQQLGTNPTDEQIREMLRGFHLSVPIATDAGAVQSVRKLIAEVKVGQPFSIGRADLRKFVESAVPSQELRSIRMSPRNAQLRMLDDAVRKHDSELWRTKQVNDFLCGIWAQGYGQIYAGGIGAVMIARRMSQVFVVVILASLILKRINKKEHGQQS
jgi:hypothetical protein